jgi:YD repeat-containing protein
MIMSSNWISNAPAGRFRSTASRIMARRAGFSLIALAGLTCVGESLAQSIDSTVFVWEEFSKRISKSAQVKALGPDMFGDNIRLANGELSFEVTDISLPGNSRLPVELTRTYEMTSRKQYLPEAMLADWQIKVPNISGMFAPNWANAEGLSDLTRCSNFDGPPVPNHFEVESFWSGLQVQMPGGGGELMRTLPATARPQDGNSYPWTTSGQVFFSCLGSVGNTTGEGFLAITPDGTRYWFDWMAQTAEAALKAPQIVLESPIPPPDQILTRRRNYLLATKVQDRFGNTVQYQYANAWNEAPKLTSIVASDGRQITLTYGGQNVIRASDGTRTWNYAYDETSVRRGLSGVTLPDGSRWGISFRDFTRAELRYVRSIPQGEIMRNCIDNEMPTTYPAAQVTGTLTHPSGAVAQYTMKSMEHGRNLVPLNCRGISEMPGPGPQPQPVPYPGYGNDPNDDINSYTISGYNWTLAEKVVSGSGLNTLRWSYSYTPNIGIFRYPGQVESYPVCPYGDTVACQAPPCTSDSCATVSLTTVLEPGGVWTRYSHGNTYRYNEGKLLKVEQGSSESNVLRSTRYRYDYTGTGQAYPPRYGTSLKLYGEGWDGEHPRPRVETEVAQQGTTFSTLEDQFDYFARPLRRARFSSLGYGRTEAYTWYDDVSRWVLGQRQAVTCIVPSSCNGQVISSVSFDPVTALPLQFHAFGALQQTLTYHPDGSIATVSDGRDGAGVDTTMTLLDWKRGIPQSVHYSDGAVELVDVSNQGLITLYADPNGYVRQYGYDLAGRPARTDYPAQDTVAWSPETSTFEVVNAVEHGLAAGHWRQTTQIGTYRKQVFFDAMWRPVVVTEEDIDNSPGTLRWTATRYDDQGRPVFVSYPRNPYLEGATSYLDPALPGTTTFYDQIDRTTRVEQSSELGVLSTVYTYLDGFATRVTNPRGFSTTTQFMALDEPSTDLPVLVDEPEGVSTTIQRDAYGKPVSITRQGVAE